MSKALNVNLIAMVALGILVLATEPYIAKLDRKHFGWVSMHSMAIVKNTRPANSLVGYTCEFEDGYKFYFSRYSILFTVFTKYLLRPFESDSALHLYLSRQSMNIIYVAIMGVMLLIATRLLGSDAGAPLVVLLSGAGFITLAFKNMYHFDQPALLAFFIFIYLLVKYDPDHLHRKRGGFLLSVALLSMVGRSHVIALGCLVWVILEALMGVSRDIRKRVDWQRNLVLSVSALLVSASTIAANIVFNVSVEARLNNVGWAETGIVGSAEKRLGLDTRGSFSTMEFVGRQLEVFSLNSAPEILGAFVVDHRHLATFVTGLGVLAGLCLLICVPSFFNSVLRGMFSKEYDQRNREKILLIMAISGPVYVFAMSHWSFFHEYSGIYYLGTYLAFWIFVAGILKPRRTMLRAILLLVALLFVLSIADVRGLNATISDPVNYADLDRQALLLAGMNSPSVYVEGGYEDFIPGSPYAMCYFLSPSRIAESSGSADWTLSREGERYVLTKRN